MPIPSDDPYDYWNPDDLEGRGILSMRHAAVAAGLGTLGKNTMLLSRSFGNTLNIGAVLTSLDLPSDELAESVCLPDCRLCLKACPAGALNGVTVNQKLCRTNTYETNERGFEVTKCNACRVVCPMRYGAGKTL